MPAHDPMNGAGHRPAWQAVTEACAFLAEMAMLVLLIVTPKS